VVDGHGTLRRGLTGGLGHQHLLPEGDLIAVERGAHSPGHGIGPRREDRGRIIAVRIIIPDLGRSIEAGVTVKNVGRTGPKGRATALDEIGLGDLIAIVRPTRGGKTHLWVGSADDPGAGPIEPGIGRSTPIVDTRRGRVGVPSVETVVHGDDVRRGLRRIDVKHQGGPGTVRPSTAISAPQGKGGAHIVLARGKETWIETPTPTVPGLISGEGGRRTPGSDVPQGAVQVSCARDVPEIGSPGPGHIKETRDGRSSRRKVQGGALTALGPDHHIIQPRRGEGRHLFLGIGIGLGRVAASADIDGLGEDRNGRKEEKE